MTGAYSVVRQQFGISIDHMEGIEDKVGKIAALSYMMEGARIFGCTAVDNGIQPPVVSSVMKAYTTDISRPLISDAMDVRSEERRVGKECVSTCRSRCSPDH